MKTQTLTLHFPRYVSKQIKLQKTTPGGDLISSFHIAFAFPTLHYHLQAHQCHKEFSIFI